MHLVNIFSYFPDIFLSLDAGYGYSGSSWGSYKKNESHFMPNFSFNDGKIRKEFAQKVFTIVAVSIKTDVLL